MSFRQKILLCFLFIFLLFIVVMFPFASHTVKKIVCKGICDRTSELVLKIQEAPNNEALVQRLRDQKFRIFFRVSIITNERKVLYDSYTKRLLGPRFNHELVVSHPEVEQAFEEGVGSYEDDSKLLGQRFFYFAKAFDFHGQPYVLRTAFPYKFVLDMTHDFEMGFIGLSIAVLLLFSCMTWLIINRLTRPIQQIITAIKPYQEGTIHTLPEIKISSARPFDEFDQLALTLNSLSAKIQSHIDTLTLERNEKEAVLESLAEGVIAVDAQMRVSYINNMALKMVGRQRQELLNQDFAVAQQHKCYEILAACQNENRILTEILHIKDGGNSLYLDLIAAPKKGDSGAVLVMQDKTSHYKLMEMRKDFIANASHELKTPITIIRGFAETLHDHPDLPASTCESITKKIVRNCKRMTVLIKDLLALTDIENLSYSRLIECDLDAMVQNCCQTLLDIYPDTMLTIHKLAEGDLHFTADPSLMEMAIMNLLENAAKYSNPPAHITVTLDKKEHWIELVIADKGIGIPESDLEHIFQRFYTVNKAHSRKLGGSGLGLAIVETVVEKHFGKISVVSKLGEGSSFTILLPEKRSQEP